MRQHPIPHNILDIEFKLFGKFSAKQFGYIAVGAITGGIFLLMRSNGAIPDIIAWPAFLLFSGIGAFLGVVPINDQGADTIIGNFFTAINKPTRRVWKNAQFNQRLETISKEREIAVGRSSQGATLGQSQGIVGSGPAMDSVSQFATAEVIDSLDSEEIEKLNKITQLAQQVQSLPQMAANQAPAQQSQTPTQQQQQPQAQPQVQTQQPVQQQIQPIQQVSAPIPQTVAQLAAQPTQIQQQAPQMQSIMITSETANSLPNASVNIQTQANIPYIQYLDSLSNPIPQTLVLIKKENGTVVQAHQTNPDGLIVPSRPLEKGNYIVEIQGGGYNLPSIRFVADDKPVKPIQIKAN